MKNRWKVAVGIFEDDFGIVVCDDIKRNDNFAFADWRQGNIYLQTTTDISAREIYTFVEHIIMQAKLRANESSIIMDDCVRSVFSVDRMDWMSKDLPI